MASDKNRSAGVVIAVEAGVILWLLLRKPKSTLRFTDVGFVTYQVNDVHGNELLASSTDNRTLTIDPGTYDISMQYVPPVNPM